MATAHLEFENILEVKDVAQLVHRSTDTIYAAIHNGCLPATRMGERKWMLSKNDVFNWIKDGMHTIKPQQ